MVQPHKNPTHTGHSRGIVIFAAIILINVIISGLLLTQETAAQSDSSEPITTAAINCPANILIFSKTAGFRHTSIPNGISAIQAIASSRGWTTSATENAMLFTQAGYLAGFDVVVFLSTTGDFLNNSQQTAFENYIRGGGGFVGIHGASNGETTWPWYEGLVGTEFLNHPSGTNQFQTASMSVEEPSHPSANGLPNPWERLEEWYNFEYNPETVNGVNVVLKVDESTYIGGQMGSNHPIAWYREYDGGRSYYTALGHHAETYSDSLFRNHLEGAIEWSSGNCDPGDILQLQAPSGTITNNAGNPAFTWTNVDADYYYLYVQNSVGQQVINEVYASNVCSGQTCTVTPTNLRESNRLNAGTYTAYLNTWNNGAQGQVAGPFTFTLNAAPPGLVTLNAAQNTNTLRPTVVWSLSGSATNATSFNLYIAPSDNIGAGVLFQNFTRTQANCGGDTSCAVTLPLDLTDDTDYSIFVQSIGPGGALTTTGPYNNGYAGPAANASSFTVDAPIPNVPSGLSINFGQNFPDISWNDDANAISFNIYIGYAPNWGQVLFQNIPRAGNCSGGTCRFIPKLTLLNGSYNFAVQGVGVGGASTDGIYNNGYAGQENFVVNRAAPIGANSGFSPSATTLTTGRPTFTWNTVSNATAYLLWVGKADYTPLYQEWLWAGAPVCTNHPGTCAQTPSLNLPEGDYLWNVRPYGPGGLGSWGTGAAFTINTTAPGLVTLNTPNNVLTVFSPTFTWNNLSAAEWYNVWIGDPAVTTSYHTQWYNKSDICSGGTCTLNIPTLNLVNGAYLWNVQAANPAGIGVWTAAGKAFSVNVPTPAAPGGLSPTDEAIIYSTNRPTFTWNTVANSQGYYLEVLNGGGGLVYGQVHTSTDAVCSPTSCSVQLPTPIPYGGYRWRVVPGNLNGAGTSTALLDFIALSINNQPLMVQADDGAILQNGAWFTVSDERAVSADYLVTENSTPDAALTLTFTGTQIDVISIAAPDYGSFTLEVDGVIVQTVNANAAQIAYGQVTSISGLAAGTHTLRILAQGKIGIDAVSIDGQVVISVPTPPTPEPIAPEATPETTATP